MVVVVAVEAAELLSSDNCVWLLCADNRFWRSPTPPSSVCHERGRDRDTEESVMAKSLSSSKMVYKFRA